MFKGILCSFKGNSLILNEIFKEFKKNEKNFKKKPNNLKFSNYLW